MSLQKKSLLLCKLLLCLFLGYRYYFPVQFRSLSLLSFFSSSQHGLSWQLAFLSKYMIQAKNSIGYSAEGIAFLFLISLCYIHTRACTLHLNHMGRNSTEAMQRGEAGCQLMYPMRRVGGLCGTAGWIMLCGSHALSHCSASLAHK